STAVSAAGAGSNDVSSSAGGASNDVPSSAGGASNDVSSSAGGASSGGASSGGASGADCASVKTSSERSRFGVPVIGSSASGGRWPFSTRLSESESRRRSASTSRISTGTTSPCETTSRGFSTWRWASSEM